MGFPGWHIECTAMSTKYLGNPFDIHTGGEDHIAIHHTNEIAQGFGAFGKQTANYWMHNAFITFGGSKISKSTGGLYTVFDLIDLGFDPLDYRYLALSSHYRKGMEFSLESLKVAREARQKLSQAAEGEGDGKVISKVVEQFKEKIADDLAMPEAMAVVWKMMKGDYKKEDIKATLKNLDLVLGLKLGERVEEEIPEEIKKLVSERLVARNNKNWAESDRIRDLLKEKGYLIEDLKNDCKIRKVVII
jgi:cysteinyl-tRNA synthetase